VTGTAVEPPIGWPVPVLGPVAEVAPPIVFVPLPGVVLPPLAEGEPPPGLADWVPPPARVPVPAFEPPGGFAGLLCAPPGSG